MLCSINGTGSDHIVHLSLKVNILEMEISVYKYSEGNTKTIQITEPHADTLGFLIFNKKINK